MKLATLVIPLFAAITLGTPLSKRATLIASYQSCLSEIHEVTPNTASGCGPSGAVERINGSNNTNTLVALTMLPGFEGQNCTLNFLNPWHISGTAGVQLFTVGGAVTGQESWSFRPFRDVYVGTFTAELGGVYASWTESAQREFVCPAAGTELYYEAVPTGDDDAVFWTTASAVPEGLVITVG